MSPNVASPSKFIEIKSYDSEFRWRESQSEFSKCVLEINIGNVVFIEMQHKRNALFFSEWRFCFKSEELSFETKFFEVSFF